MAKEFQEEVRRRKEQEERKQEAQEAQEQRIQEPKKSTTLVPNSPPVPALRQGELEGERNCFCFCIEPVFLTAAQPTRANVTFFVGYSFLNYCQALAPNP